MTDALSRDAAPGTRALDPLLNAARALVRGRRRTSPQHVVDHTGEEWRKSLEQIVDEVPQVRERLEQDLETASSRASFDAVQKTLAEVVEEGERALEGIRSLDGLVDRLRVEWDAELRYTPEGLATLREQLAARIGAKGRGGAQAWLQELLDAADAREEAAAARIASADLPWPEELRA